MKIWGLVGASLVVAGPAFAADLAVKAPVYKAPPPPVYGWTGFYLGGNIGWAGGDSSMSIAPANAFANQVFTQNEVPTALSPNASGVMGGGQVGYNWQTAPQWVLGAEADIQGSGYKGTATVTPVPQAGPAFTTSVTEKNDWFGTVRARAGYLVTPSLLVYGTGGLAFGQTDTSFATAASNVFCQGVALCAAGSAQSTHAGWAAGAGVEYMFLPGWSVKAEYLRVDLGSLSLTAVSAANLAATYTVSTKFEENIVRGGVNFHF